MPLKFLLPIIGEEAEWYSLQKDVREGSPLLDSTPSIIDYAEAFGDLNDTAALIAELDLVITIDCVICHRVPGETSVDPSRVSIQMLDICAIGRTIPGSLEHGCFLSDLKAIDTASSPNWTPCCARPDVGISGSRRRGA